MINTIIQAVLPIFFAIFVGWIAGKKKIIQAEHRVSLIKFVTLIALPILLFNSTSGTSAEKFADIKVISLTSFGFLSMFFFTYFTYQKIFKVNKKEVTIASITTSFPNITFVGIPVLFKLYGSSSMTLIVISTILASIIIVPLTIVFIESNEKKQNSTFKNIINLLVTPMIIAPLLGLVFSIFNIYIPDFMRTSFSLVGDTAPGVALFTMGVGMAYSNLKFSKEVFYLILSKNIILPLIFLGLLLIFGVKGIAFKQLLLISSLPTATIAPLLGSQYRAYEVESNSAAILGTLLSIVSLGIIIFMTN
jgi:predicted permease